MCKIWCVCWCMYYAWMHGGDVLWEGHIMGWLGFLCAWRILHINKLVNPHHTISSTHPSRYLLYYLPLSFPLHFPPFHSLSFYLSFLSMISNYPFDYSIMNLESVSSQCGAKPFYTPCLRQTKSLTSKKMESHTVPRRSYSNTSVYMRKKQGRKQTTREFYELVYSSSPVLYYYSRWSSFDPEQIPFTPNIDRSIFEKTP